MLHEMVRKTIKGVIREDTPEERHRFVIEATDRLLKWSRESMNGRFPFAFYLNTFRVAVDGNEVRYYQLTAECYPTEEEFKFYQKWKRVNG